MYRTQCALTFLALCVGVAHSFDWELILAGHHYLDFYYNENITYTLKDPIIKGIKSVAFDPVHNKVLIVDGKPYVEPRKPNTVTIYNLDMETQTIQERPLITSLHGKSQLNKIVFDPVTELLFWGYDRYIDKYLAKPGANIGEYQHSLIILDRDTYVQDFAVDSCRGYIYWATNNNIERAQLDGSEREVIIDSGITEVYSRRGLAIDQHAMKIYWIERAREPERQYIESADLNGDNRKTFYIIEEESQMETLAVTKHFIYCSSSISNVFLKIPKNPTRTGDPKLTITNLGFRGIKHIAVNLNCCNESKSYVVDGVTRKIESCNAKEDQPPYITVPNPPPDPRNASRFCVHGTEVDGESRCECELGYTGERCSVSICDTIRQPEKSSYHYCYSGECSTTVYGQPKCSCWPNAYGERCELDRCQWYCLNNAHCSTYNGIPHCDCGYGYTGKRCEFSTYLVECIQTASFLKGTLYTDFQRLPVTLIEGANSTCDRLKESNITGIKSPFAEFAEDR